MPRLALAVTADARDGTFTRRFSKCGIVAQGMGLRAVEQIRFAYAKSAMDRVYPRECEITRRLTLSGHYTV
jgi:hypothetical protein